MFDWASVAAAGVNLIGNIAGTAASSNLNGRNRRWQSAEAEKAYQRQREFYTDFSSPSAMMRQYRQAGINPNYALQSGSLNSSPVGVQQANTPQTYDVGEQISTGTSRFAQLVQNANLMQSQTNKNNAEANKVNLTTPKELEKLGYDTETAKSIAAYAASNQEMDLQLKNQELQLKTAQTAAQNAMANVYHWDALNKQFEFENIKPLEMQQIQTSINKDIAQIGLLVAQKQLAEEEAKLAIANVYKTYMDAVSNRISANAQATAASAAMMNAETNRAELPSRIDLNYATAENQTSQSGKAIAETEGTKLDNDTKRQTSKFVFQSMKTSCEILGKENRWFNARQVGGMIKDIGVGIGSAVGGVASAATSIGKLGL